MSEPSDSRHPRDAFAVLVAARPRPPAELTSPDSREAEDLFRRILDGPHLPRTRKSHHRQFTLAVTGTAAAAIVGILLTVPGRGGPAGVGSGDTVPAQTQAETEVPTPDLVTASEWPEIPPSPLVGDANTARATMIINGDVAFGRTDFTMVDGDVNIGVYQAPADPNAPLPGPNGRPTPVGPPELVAENRYVAGEWYFHLPGEDGELEWSYDPNDEGTFVGVTPSDPRELYDRLAPTAGFEADGTDFARGVETVHLVATTPEAIDPSLIQFDPAISDSTESVELWVDSNGVVRRIDVTVTGTDLMMDPGATDVVEVPRTTTVSIEFYDIGEPITVEVPRDAVEIDGQG
jgi:hypothetical protein